MQSIHSLLSYLSKAKFTDKSTLESLLAAVFVDPQGFYRDDIPTYSDETQSTAQAITKSMEEHEVTVTNDVSSHEIPSNSVAYHRVFGSILADDNYRWWFSTERMIREMKAADTNPKIVAHFIHIKSGGGEAWLLDKAFETIQNLNKPVVVFIQKMAASAGYYFAAPADKIYSYTQNDTIGSIGTMVYFLDFMPYYKELGVVEHEYYADKSDLKNKKFNDLLNGKPEKYIKEELDPLQEQFETAVRSARPQLAALAEDHPAVRGETFDAIRAKEIGLIDEIADLEVAVLDAHQRGMEYAKQNEAHKQALSYI